MNFSAIQKFFSFLSFFFSLFNHYHREFNLSNNLKSEKRFSNIVFKLPMS